MEQHPAQPYNDEISIKDLIHMALKQKKLILTITILITILAIAFAIVVKPPITTTTSRISLKSESIAEGLNPDESKFSYDQIISPSILKSVIQANNLTSKITMTDLREMIKVTPYIPYEIAQLYALKGQTDYIEKVEYNPTEYILSIDTNWLSPINERQASVLLEAIINTYSSQFIDKFGKDVYLGNVSINYDLENYDYNEALDMIKSDLQLLKTSSDQKNEVASKFRGLNGITFRELSDSVSLVLEVDYSRAQALTSVFNLTKDIQKSIKRYEYLIKNSELEYQKAYAETASVKAVLASIDKPESLIIDGTDLNSEELLLTQLLGAASGDDYYNTLVIQAAESGEKAATHLTNKLYYEQELAMFTNSIVLPEDLAWAKKEVETDIGLIHEFIVSTFNTFNELNQEYRETLINDTIKITLQPSSSKSLMKFLLIPVIGGILGIMFGCFVALMKEYWTAAPVVDKTRRLR